MAKKKPAAKMPVKKPVAKAAGKKTVAKAPSKKAGPMSKKAPVKKAPVKKAPVKKAPVKKAAPKKVEKKVAPKSLKEKALKFVTKAVKGLTKEQEKKLREKEKLAAMKEKEKIQKEAAREKERLAKEAAKAKALALKDKEKQAKERARDKELEIKQKEQEKLRLKQEKEAEKARIKADKEAGKPSKGPKKPKYDEDEDEEHIELGPDEEPAFGEENKARKTEEDDFDEFEEDYKKSKATKKSGKKAYEEDVTIDHFPVSKGKKYNSAVLADLEVGISDEIIQLREHFNWKEIAEAIGSMDFFIDAKNDECIEKGCDNIRTTQSYCRLHYLRNWKTIQKKREILKDGKLQEYIEELISKYPPKYIEALLSDLSDDKEFYRVLNELNITSEFDFEEDEFENAVDDDDSDDDIGIETISSSLRYEDE